MERTAEVEGIGMGVAPDGQNVPAVILEAGEAYLPIFITADQAQSIHLALSGEPFERPLTHDLLVEMLTEFGGAVDGIRIDDLSDGTFYAKIDVERYDDGHPERFVFDARPSDAIAIAVRTECSITVTDDVLEEAGRDPGEFAVESGPPGEPPAPGELLGDDPEGESLGTSEEALEEEELEGDPFEEDDDFEDPEVVSEEDDEDAEENAEGADQDAGADNADDEDSF